MGPKRDRSLFHPISLQRLVLMKRGHLFAVMPFPTVRGLLATNIDRHATGGRNMLLSMKGVPFGELGFKCGRVRKAVFSQKSLALKTGYPDSASCVTVAWWNYITDF